MIMMSNSAAHPHLIAAPPSNAAGPEVRLVGKNSRINEEIMVYRIHCAFLTSILPELLSLLQLCCSIALTDTSSWAGGS